MCIRDSPLIQDTKAHLEQYGLVGLRTLLLSKRAISEEEYQMWNDKYSKACVEEVDRETKMMAVQEELERNMCLIGATAIEDKLQDDVGDTIFSLKACGIKVWVLTGDKIETAINIGYSCKLLNDTLTQIIIDGKSAAIVNTKLDEGIKKIENKEPDEKFAMVISGDALIYSINPDHPELGPKVLKIGEQCNAVIACRVSPLQKQEVVELVRKHKPDVITLAIGDGANDVNMITAAHVGIGIRGVEGQQAARASDFSIGEFRLLKRLLVFHGREAYRRNSYLICYGFYKNLILVLPQFWYTFENGFSAVFLYDIYLLMCYNLFFTALPIVVFAIWDLEYKEETFMNNAKLYVQGMKSELFNFFVFWRWLILAALHSCALLLISYWGLDSIYQPGGAYLFLSGQTIFLLIVLYVNLKIFTFTNSVHFLCLTAFIFSIGIYFLIFFGLDHWIYADTYATFEAIISSKNVLACVLLGLAVLTLWDLALERYLSMNRRYNLKDVGEKDEDSVESEMELSSLSLQTSYKRQMTKRPIQRRYTGYAYSDFEAVDPLVMKNYRGQQGYCLLLRTMGKHGDAQT
eukprot:TRINITY_DN3570_c0_g1_i2.p1 TRINITY_DN3570_c0_g1~~TRINITY_DN3570_c0_g1_i2.p1  ORF type:complete len:576 (-),score=133.02 TRINITY_DN3570_c0_g1_i2:171-1898(-)